MPEKANHSGFDKCNSCASTSNGPGLGPLSTVSHPQVCCLFKVAQPGQSTPFPNEGSHKRYDYDRLCENCPSRRKFQEELQVGPVYQPPPRSSNAPQEGCEAAPGVAGSPSRKLKRIEPRLRPGFKKLTLEWRPPRFKQKLWFGTYSEGNETHRARDALNYYLSLNEPYFLPDSPMIFGEIPLKGIRYVDLLPSCDQVFEGEAAYIYFARQVKEVIHSVLGKQKKRGQRKKRCKVSQVLRKEAFQRLDTYDPIGPSAPGSTTSSDTECVSCPYSTANSQLSASYPMLSTTPTTFTQDDEANSQLASYPMFLLPPRTSTQEYDANSQLAASYPMVLPPPTMQDDEELNALLTSVSQIQPDELLGNQLGEVNFPLYENFSFPSIIPTSSDSDSTMEENRYSTDLWNYFPSADPSFPSK